MKELADQVFRHFGLKAVFAVVCASILIWWLAHWNAVPGHNVSVLWGLVQYTKPTPQEPTRPGPIPIPFVSSLKKPDQITSVEENHKGRVEVIGHSYSKASWSAARLELRKLRGLRELSALESGKQWDTMPAGTFGFVDAMDLGMGKSPLGFGLSIITVRRFDSKDLLPFGARQHQERKHDIGRDVPPVS